MKLTLYTDYSLRVLLYLSMNEHREKRVQIDDLSKYYKINRNHLVKVVNHLAQKGYIETVRGRNGGMRLIIDPKEVTVGQVVRDTEENFYITECFRPDNECILTPVCGLQGVLHSALGAFMEKLDSYTLYEITPKQMP